jgi:hypothetical protein
MIAFDGSQALWYIVAGVGAAVAVAWVASVRRFARWVGRRAKAAYFEWFREAVDEHVEPKFVALREQTEVAAEEVKQNSLTAAAAIKEEAIKTAVAVRDEMLATADTVKEELRVHTEEEGRIVAEIVREAIDPIKVTLDARTPLFEHLETTLTDTQSALADHMSHDEQMTEAAKRSLEAGQKRLITELAKHHKENQARFVAIEQRLDITKAPAKKAAARRTKGNA